MSFVGKISFQVFQKWGGFTLEIEIGYSKQIDQPSRLLENNNLLTLIKSLLLLDLFIQQTLRDYIGIIGFRL